MKAKLLALLLLAFGSQSLFAYHVILECASSGQQKMEILFLYDDEAAKSRLLSKDELQDESQTDASYTVLGGDAKVTESGNRVVVKYTDDSPTDWTDPALQGRCFVTKKLGYTFSSELAAGEIKAIYQSWPHLEVRPDTPCSLPHLMRAPPVNLVCKPF